MPTYQYACRECDHAFDQVQSFSEDSLTDCPRCEGRLRKVFNAVGVVFKGSGFYRNDSRVDVVKSEGSSSDASAAKESSKQGSSESSDSSSGSDGSPAASPKGSPDSSKSSRTTTKTQTQTQTKTKTQADAGAA